MQRAESNEWVEVKLADREVGCGNAVENPIILRNNSGNKVTFLVSVESQFAQRDELIEWQLSLTGPSKKEELSVSPSENKKMTVEISLEPKETREFRFVVATPKGGFKKDTAKFTLKIQYDSGSVTQSMQITLIPVIVAVKTTVGNEIPVSRDLAKKSEKDKEERAQTYSSATNEILAIMAPKDVKGYIFVETMHPDRIPYLGKDVRGYKGEVKGEISIEEIEHYLEPKPAVTGLELGALVELIDGPFKGERAKIMAIDPTKEEVTVQLIESLVPIPVTVNAEAIRMLDTK
ncbi:MAG: transcription elongation factor Spt5 [Thermoplasmataceae archaeon]|jgi:transcriptional antiterminator NusG|nr:transcription elongation factor Spt5 [Candidatus Thermoplasmatota archaeon]MCL5439982.1 transcription elongation factor Spt5 [Candidatus Thermoplasmatota archaeon]